MGSEMCIRDRYLLVHVDRGLIDLPPALIFVVPNRRYLSEFHSFVKCRHPSVCEHNGNNIHERKGNIFPRVSERERATPLFIVFKRFHSDKKETAADTKTIGRGPPVQTTCL